MANVQSTGPNSVMPEAPPVLDSVHITGKDSPSYQQPKGNINWSVQPAKNRKAGTTKAGCGTLGVLVNSVFLLVLIKLTKGIMGTTFKALPAAAREALDRQVRENPQLTAQQLRAGAGPTEIPLGGIDPILLGSRKAHTEVENSKVRQGISAHAATRNSGFQLLDSLSSKWKEME
ncbi:hypothetical protein FB451DRAFT_1164409 [Mycena latifolia]|nr:hypothetical protein FB451DRAFT_1164409 [Mycena latifolia]